MMKKWLTLLLLPTIFLLSCSTAFKKPPTNEPSTDAGIQLAEAAVSISNSMLEMTQIEKVVTCRHPSNHHYIPSTYNLQTRASVDWSGPIEELTERIAKAAKYRLNVLGKEPAVPVLISLTAKDQSLVEILRNIDYQAGKKATIRVYPNNQVVELRYAKIYS
jgi:defect-in-organelle-trafficking protein DotD